MEYMVGAFDRSSELLAFEVELPENCDVRLKQIMGWTAPQRGDEGYDLSPSQAAAIEVLTGKPFYDHDHIFQLTCRID